jgi:hypothetical protein
MPDDPNVCRADGGSPLSQPEQNQSQQEDRPFQASPVAGFTGPDSPASGGSSGPPTPDTTSPSAGNNPVTPVFGLLGPMPEMRAPVPAPAPPAPTIVEGAGEAALPTEAAGGELALGDLLGPLLFLLMLSGDTPPPKKQDQQAVEEKSYQFENATDDAQQFSSDPPGNLVQSCSASQPQVSLPPVAASAPAPAPAATPVPAPKAAPVMPSNLTATDQELWDECIALHDDYKQTQKSMASRSAEMKFLAAKQPASLQDKIDFCNLLAEQIKEAEKYHQQRQRYIDNGCDKFDYFKQGTTEAQRRASHEGELYNVDRQIKNMRELERQFCPPI